MPDITISTDDLAALQAKVAKLVSDKGTADAATAASNAAQSALAQAQQAAQDANVAEATADGQVTSDVKDLETFVQTLAGDAPPPPPPPAPTP